MKFEEVLPALREGKKIRRRCGYYIKNNRIVDEFGVASDILQDDWEIVEEKNKKIKLRDLTPEQFKTWRRRSKNCRKYEKLI